MNVLASFTAQSGHPSSPRDPTGASRSGQGWGDPFRVTPPRACQAAQKGHAVRLVVFGLCGTTIDDHVPVGTVNAALVPITPMAFTAALKSAGIHIFPVRWAVGAVHLSSHLHDAVCSFDRRMCTNTWARVHWMC